MTIIKSRIKFYQIILYYIIWAYLYILLGYIYILNEDHLFHLLFIMHIEVNNGAEINHKLFLWIKSPPKLLLFSSAIVGIGFYWLKKLSLSYISLITFYFLASFLEWISFSKSCYFSIYSRMCINCFSKHNDDFSLAFCLSTEQFPLIPVWILSWHFINWELTL